MFRSFVGARFCSKFANEPLNAGSVNFVSYARFDYEYLLTDFITHYEVRHKDKQI
jgi:hypothetical protein